MSVCVCMYKLFSLSVNLSKLEEVTTLAGREFQSQIVAGKNECLTLANHNKK